MEVSLISMTESCLPPGPDDHHVSRMTSEELITYTARVSNPGNQMNTETAPKLIAFLIKNKHWSPFEMVDMTLRIVTSRAIAQQILRHRSFSFQEFSQRYAKVTEMEDVQLRKAGATNRQSSTEAFDPDITSYGGTQIEASTAIELYIREGQRIYGELLDAGVAKECARMVLPLTTQSVIFMKGSIRSWVHYLQIRCDPHTQLEHRQVAEEIRKIFIVQFPNIATALEL